MQLLESTGEQRQREESEGRVCACVCVFMKGRGEKVRVRMSGSMTHLLENFFDDRLVLVPLSAEFLLEVGLELEEVVALVFIIQESDCEHRQPISITCW